MQPREYLRPPALSTQLGRGQQLSSAPHQPDLHLGCRDTRGKRVPDLTQGEKTAVASAGGQQVSCLLGKVSGHQIVAGAEGSICPLCSCSFVGEQGLECVVDAERGRKALVWDSG